MAISTLTINREEQEGIKRKYDTSRIYFAQVMDTRDPLHAGRLKVWLISSGTDKTNKENWIIARHSSGFYGTTPIQMNGSKESPSSYGDVNSIPYPGTLVAVFFPPVVGEYVYPFWFSCPVDDIMNRMAAGLGGDLPYKEFNAIDIEEGKKPEIPQTVEPLIEGIEIQGLNKDKLRGYGSNTPNRGDFPTCYSFTTPLGNVITMDDGWSVNDPNGNWDTKPDDNEIKVNGKQHDLVNWNGNMSSPTDNTRFNAGIRLRTRSGTQVLISDNGNIYAINKNGTAWVELSNDGNIDCWSEGGINLSTSGDMNLHSSGDINMEATGKINMTSREMYIGTSKVNMDAQELDVAGEIKSQSIQSTKGVIDKFTSTMGQVNGIFQGTLNGMASISGICTFVPANLPSPEMTSAKLTTIETTEPSLIPAEMDSEGNVKTQYSICSRVPTHEPYAPHNIDEQFEEALKKKEKEDGRKSE